MSQSFVKNITKNSAYKNLSRQYKIPLDECNPKYSHLTFRVTSLSQYIDVINILKLASKKDRGDLIFRGMADHRWELLPSIARKTLITEETEYKMVKELMLLYPEEFMEISSNFDLLAKMQHYGLPTRLLDFTTNPLVALYFACQKEKNDSVGRIISSSPSYPEYLDEIDVVDKCIEAVCGLCKVKSFGGYHLESLIQNVISFDQFIYCTQHPLIAKPQYLNSRIKNQSAVFMVFQNEVWDYGAMKAYDRSKNIDPTDPMAEYRPHQIILRENLTNIYSLTEANASHIESWFTTPDILFKICQCHLDDKNMGDVPFVERLDSKQLSAFPERFIVVPQIKKISSEIMCNDFCSILIEPKYKKKILEELDVININERFLFPELKYTVEHVKNKYFSS